MPHQLDPLLRRKVQALLPRQHLAMDFVPVVFSDIDVRTALKTLHSNITLTSDGKLDRLSLVLLLVRIGFEGTLSAWHFPLQTLHQHGGWYRGVVLRSPNSFMAANNTSDVGLLGNIFCSRWWVDAVSCEHIEIVHPTVRTRGFAPTSY